MKTGGTLWVFFWQCNDTKYKKNTQKEIINHGEGSEQKTWLGDEKLVLRGERIFNLNKSVIYISFIIIIIIYFVYCYFFSYFFLIY